MAIHLELCRKNSIGILYREPTIVEEVRVETEEEAEELVRREMANGFYYRRLED